MSAETWRGQGCYAKPQLPASSSLSGCGQVPRWHGVAVTPPFPHCRTCSTQDDTSSELRRGAPPDGGEQLAASAFQGRRALARYLCVLPARGEREPFVPDFDTGDLCGVGIPSFCTAFKGCRDQRL